MKQAYHQMIQTNALRVAMLGCGPGGKETELWKSRCFILCGRQWPGVSPSPDYFRLHPSALQETLINNGNKHTQNPGKGPTDRHTTHNVIIM